MKKFEAPTLEEAYAQAAREFSCSVTELEIQVVQNPARGFLGFGKKPAIIVAAAPQRRRTASSEKSEIEERRSAAPKEPSETLGSPAESASFVDEQKEETGPSEEILAVVEEVIAESGGDEEAPVPAESGSANRRELETDEIFENFYNETPDIHSVVPEIEAKLRELFAHACFRIDTVEVSAYDEETVLVEFNGADAALLIGKEGYRYKALAYLLYNWIHGRYGFRVRLEIAEFLHNQETMIENYLEPIVERVRKEGRAQTKVLDGILVQIALKRLRELFPDKYVAVRTNREGGRYVIVNEFLEKR